MAQTYRSWKNAVRRAQSTNPFDLFHDHPDALAATKEMRLCIGKFIRELGKIQQKYAETGATDTAASDAIISYIRVAYSAYP